MKHKSIIDLLKKYDICIKEEIRSSNARKYTCKFNALYMEWYTLHKSPEAIGTRIRKITDSDNLEINYLAGFFVKRLKEIEFYIINNK